MNSGLRVIPRLSFTASFQDFLPRLAGAALNLKAYRPLLQKRGTELKGLRPLDGDSSGSL